MYSYAIKVVPTSNNQQLKWILIALSFVGAALTSSCLLSLQMLTSVQLNTTVAVSTSASTSQEITGALAMMASAWHTMATTVWVSVCVCIKQIVFSEFFCRRVNYAGKCCCIRVSGNICMKLDVLNFILRLT